MSDSQVVQLSRKERSILTDAISWVLEERRDRLNEQQIESLTTCLETANNEMVVDRRETPPRVISLVFNLFSSEIQNVVSDMDDSEDVFEFYEDAFKSIDDKLSYSDGF